MEDYIGIIKLFAGSFAPRGWQFCQGQLLSISQNTALFSILGTTYGGNGITTFALPNLSGLVPLGSGISFFSGTRYMMGETGGKESISLKTGNLPPHKHNCRIRVSSTNAEYSQPKTTSALAVPVKTGAGDLDSVHSFSDHAPDVILDDESVIEEAVGRSEPISIVQPYIVMNYIICTDGVFPPRE